MLCLLILTNYEIQYSTLGEGINNLTLFVRRILILNSELLFSLHFQEKENLVSQKCEEKKHTVMRLKSELKRKENQM